MKKYEQLKVLSVDVRHEAMDMQERIDEKAESIADYYGYDSLRHSVRIYEREDIINKDGIDVTISWPSLGEVSIHEAEKFMRILETAIDEGKNACCVGMAETFDPSEATFSPYGSIDDNDEDEDNGDEDVIDYPEEEADDGATFYVETEVASSVPRWWWLDSVMNMDRYNREEGIYKSEGLEAEAAAFEAISLVEDVEDDDLKKCDSETTAWATYERKLDDVARIVAYNETLQKWCLDDLMPRLSIKVTMYRSPNDGQEYDDVETTVTTCDEVTGVELVADEARRYARQADDGIVDAMING